MLDREPLRAIARRYGTSPSSLVRHRPHILPAVIEQAEALESHRLTTVLQDVVTARDRGERLYAAAEQILRRALEQQDDKIALAAIKAAVDILAEARAYLELRGEITGELRRPQAHEPSADEIAVALERRLLELLGPGQVIDTQGQVIDTQAESVPQIEAPAAS